MLFRSVFGSREPIFFALFGLRGKSGSPDPDVSWYLSYPYALAFPSGEGGTALAVTEEAVIARSMAPPCDVAIRPPHRLPLMRELSAQLTEGEKTLVFCMRSIHHAASVSSVVSAVGSVGVMISVI